MPFVYLLRWADGTLYVGHTADPTSREKAHNEGHGSKYTAAREHQVKRWTTEKKEALVLGDLGTLKVLSRQQGDARRKRVAFTWRDLIKQGS